jgi:hypothetical protein
MAIEIVDLPFLKMVILHSYVSHKKSRYLKHLKTLFEVDPKWMILAPTLPAAWHILHIFDPG